MVAAATITMPPKRLQSFHDRRQRPVRQTLLDLNRQAVAPIFGCIDRRSVVFQYDMMRIFGKAQARQPAPVHVGPRRAVIVMTVPDRKAGQLLAGMTQATHGGQSGSDKVSHCFVSTVRDPYRRDLASTM